MWPSGTVERQLVQGILNAGSSKQGNASRASVASNWVKMYESPLGGRLVEPGGAAIETLREAHRKPKLGAGGQRLRRFDDQALAFLDQLMSRRHVALLAGELEALDRLAAGVQLETRRRALHLEIDRHRPGIAVLGRINAQFNRLGGRNDVGGQSQSAGRGVGNGRTGTAGSEDQGKTSQQEVSSHRGPLGKGKVGVRKS